MKSRSTPDTYAWYSPTTGNHYNIAITLPTPLGITAYFYAMINTGADDFVISDAYLSDFFPGGIPTTTVPITTAGGIFHMPIVKGHSFSVDGVTVTADIVFSASLTKSAALCGRVPLMGCSTKFGLRSTELLRV